MPKRMLVYLSGPSFTNRVIGAWVRMGFTVLGQGNGGIEEADIVVMCPHWRESEKSIEEHRLALQLNKTLAYEV